jgi:hypothetical protein
MCRAEISQEDCTKVKENFSTIAHRREVDLKQRKKEKETMERQQLKKQQLERQARLKQEKKERDKREEAHVLGLAGVAQRQAEEVAKMEQLKKDQAAARIVLQKKQNQEKAEKNKLLKAKKKEALRQEKLKASAKTLATNKPVELESEPRQRKKKKKQPRQPRQQRKDREDRRPKQQAKKQLQEERRKNKNREWFWTSILFIVVVLISMFSQRHSQIIGRSELELAGKFSSIDLYDASFSGHVKMVKRILKEHATSTRNWKVLTLVERMNLVQKKKTFFNRRFEKGLFTPLMAACQENHLKIVKLLLKIDSVDVNIPDSFGW